MLVYVSILYARKFKIMQRLQANSNSTMRNASRIAPRKNLRGKIVMVAYRHCIQSRLFLVLLLSIMSFLFATILNNSFTYILPLIYIACYRSLLIFEAIVIGNSIKYLFGFYHWYNKVDDGLYLGAIPVFEEHHTYLKKKLFLNVVLSVNEVCELSCSTLCGIPVTSAEWKDIDVLHVIIPSPDFQPPSHKLLEQGADFINNNLVLKRNVYVHCKSGQGRSASMVAAYFIKYKGYTPERAQDELRLKRPVIFGVDSMQMKNLISYAKWRRDGNKCE